MYTIIDGTAFENMLIGAYQLFQKKYEIINRLNVFPVPDGDTGNNMLNTLRSMYSMISQNDDKAVGIIAEKAAAGAIMGARGNSGVILSQIIHGISRGLHGKKNVTSREMSKAFQYGILYAYRSVTKPVEGTILSVARGIAKGTRAVLRNERDFSKVLAAAIECGEDVLAKTPDQLAILKEANVVDAGGQGLLFFLQGCLNGLLGKMDDVEQMEPVQPVMEKLKVRGESFSIEYPYCTEFIISPCKAKAKEVRVALSTWGESMIVAEGDNLIKVHIHTQRPGRVLDMASDWGTLHDIKCDNMIDQFRKNKNINHTEKKKPLGVLSIVAGDGWTELMQNLGCEVISGGQTMNPSVKEISNAIEYGNAEKYIILPNNKNIIMAAQQVQKIVGENLVIVPSVNPMEGLAAAMAFSEEKTIEENETAMKDRMKDMVTAVITKAVRDSSVSGTVIQKGEYMGIGSSSGLIATDKTLKGCFFQLLESLVKENPDTEIITLYYGEELDEKECAGLIKEASGKYGDISFEQYHGGQPLYPIFLSVE